MVVELCAHSTTDVRVRVSVRVRVRVRVTVRVRVRVRFRFRFGVRAGGRVTVAVPAGRRGGLSPLWEPSLAT